MEELQSRIFSENPNHMDVTIIEEMFFLHLWKELPLTFASIARFLLIKAFVQIEKNIHFVFNKTVSRPIENCQLDSISGSKDRGSHYQFIGPKERRPNNWKKPLRFDQFQVSINSFVISA